MSEMQYQDLGPDDVIHEGDQTRTQYKPGEWVEVSNSIGFKVKDRLVQEFRRPIPNPPSQLPDEGKKWSARGNMETAHFKTGLYRGEEFDGVVWAHKLRDEAEPTARLIVDLLNGNDSQLSELRALRNRLAEMSQERDAALDRVAALEKRPRIVCICGSSRFVDVAAVKAWEFEKQGVMALSMHLLPGWYSGLQKHHQAESENVAHILDDLHLRKIDMADEVFVVNVDGYIGARTRIEIEYAEQHGKRVTYLQARAALNPTISEGKE